MHPALLNMYSQLPKCTVQGTSECCTERVIPTGGVLQASNGIAQSSWHDKAAHDAWPDGQQPIKTV